MTSAFKTIFTSAPIQPRDFSILELIGVHCDLVVDVSGLYEGRLMIKPASICSASKTEKSSITPIVTDWQQRTFQAAVSGFSSESRQNVGQGAYRLKSGHSPLQRGWLFQSIGGNESQ